jgi:hypothetical protein
MGFLTVLKLSTQNLHCPSLLWIDTISNPNVAQINLALYQWQTYVVFEDKSFTFYSSQKLLIHGINLLSTEVHSMWFYWKWFYLELWRKFHPIMSFVPTDLILLPIWPYGGGLGGGGGRKPTRTLGPVSPHCEPFTCYCGAEKSKVFLFPIMIDDRTWRLK